MASDLELESHDAEQVSASVAPERRPLWAELWCVLVAVGILAVTLLIRLYAYTLDPIFRTLTIGVSCRLLR